MALARIITRSPECWRELALDLLARKYAVEIVSPDAIPDNFADLELRVETDSVNDLTANIAVRGGERSTSLDFVHHLRAPMEDFIRRPPKTDAVATVAQGPINSNAGPNQSKEIELPSASSSPDLAPVPVFLELPPSSEGGVRPEAPPPQIPLPVKQTSSRNGITIIIHRSQPTTKRKTGTFKRSGGWFLRASAGFAIVVGLGGVLLMGIRHRETPAQSTQADSRRVIPVEDAGLIAAPESQPATTVDAGSRSAGSQTIREELSPKSVSPAAPSPQRKRRLENSLGEIRDLTSGDATVFRDKRAARTGSHRKVRRHYHDDTVAQDTVTYLDRKFAPGKSLR